VTKVVTPEASSSVRGPFSESEAKTLYTSGRSDLQNNRLKGELREKLGPRGGRRRRGRPAVKNAILPETLSDFHPGEEGPGPSRNPPGWSFVLS